MTPDQYLDALLGLPGLYAPAVSPDGKWAAWTWFRAGPAADVYTAPTDAAAPPLRLTDTPDDTMLVSWTPDSSAVIVAQDHDGDERARLFRVDLARPLEMQPLTAADPHYFLHEGWLHPNARLLFYAANFDAETGEEIEPTLIFRHDLATGERRPIARPRKPGWPAPELNEPGTHILYNRQDIGPSGSQVWLVDIEGREDREVLNFGPAVKTQASWHPDGRQAVVLSEAGSHRRVGIWDRDGGAVRWLVDDPARNIEAAFVPRGSDGSRAVVLEVRDAGTRASLLDIETGAETPLPPMSGNLTPLHPLADGEWVGIYGSSRQPTDLVRFSLTGPHPESFTSLTRVWERTPLRPADLAPATDYRWRSVDGREIQGWLYRAPGPALGTIVYIHGGPTSHSSDAVNNAIQFFVSQGFNVLDPNYRGSTGFSLEYQDAIKQDGWGGREQDDIRAGIEALIAEGIAAPGKVGVTGTSYGGYSSWYAITHFPPEVVAASAPICGMTDLVVDYETTRPDLRPYSEEMMGGRPDQVPDRYHERSPINFVSDIRGRLLIVQGMQDPNVSPENVRAVRSALNAAGVAYDVLAFEDEGHGIKRPKNQKILYTRLAEFFAAAFGEA
ncbi:MAG: S9 family peptidase [Chloroflexia bacterium]